LPHSNIKERTRLAAKRLRRGQTDAERKMWRLLRPFRDDGIPFRRQAPVDAS
jgi:very-short-patch-repair endonuclease